MAQLDYQYIGELVERVQEGDSNAFAELYAATYQKQYFVAYKYLHDEYLAQDALQETYISALKNIHSLKDPKLFISWLNQINFRTCFKLHEKQKRFNNEMAEFDAGIEQYVSSNIDNPESLVVDVDERKYIVKQIMTLPFTESQSIMLRYYNNMKIDEIASILGVSKSTVKRNIANGLARLKKILGE